MEDVLEVYGRAYDPLRPQVCMDESSKQLIAEVRAPIPMEAGKPERYDDEYVRNGVASIFMFVEPLTGRRRVAATQTRTRVDWAREIKQLLDVDYPDAESVVLVMDNLNTHAIASLYETFEPSEALRLAARLEIHYTPKHGSWLNMAEIEFSALSRQCLDRRIPDMASLTAAIAAWQDDRNTRQTAIHWRFTTADARIKLRHLYPKF